MSERKKKKSKKRTRALFFFEEGKLFSDISHFLEITLKKTHEGADTEEDVI